MVVSSESTPVARPPPMSLSLSSPTTSSSPSVALPSTAFTALPPSSLQDVLSDPSALILDIRPHNSYVQARVLHALSLSVPSTLLKRPNFPLARLTEMLPTSAAREKFSKWPEASRILVYDADTTTLPANLQNNNLLGLMRKFRSEGYPAEREVAWLRGGFHAVWRDHPDFVDHCAPPDEADEDEEHAEPETDGDPVPLSKTMSSPATARALRAKHLPKSAFTSATTITMRPKSIQPPAPVPMQLVPPTPVMQVDNPFSRASLPTSAAAMPPPLPGASQSQPGRGEFTLRLPPGLTRPKSNASTTSSVPRGPLYSMPTLSPQYTGAYNRVASYSLPGRQVAFNPFFDNIRQNIELGSRVAKGTDGEGIPLKLPRRVRRRVGELPFEWLRQIARKSRHATEGSSSTDLPPSDGPSSSTYKPVSEGTLRTPVTQLPQPPPPQIASTARRSPRRSPSYSPSRSVPAIPPRAESLSPPSPTSSAHSHSPSDADELTRALEDQFYNIELGEQKRLLGVMERHSMESGKVIQEAPGVRGFVGIPPSKGTEGKPSVPASANSAATVGEEAISSFPYSITAGLEKGSKNRYRNIWPFEHARVRLRKSKPDDDDYMNASYVQPLGTTKRYIATQGPLPATFADFWTLCWEQNVHVIVMLTREIEGSSVKCGKYWAEGTYGSLRLKLIETNDTPDRERRREESEMNGGFFSSHVPQPKPKLKPKSKKHKDGDVDMQDDEAPSTIKRVFELTNTAYPLAPPRIVTQFQYLEWPDLNVPNDPRGVLNLMRQVEDAVEHSRCSGQKRWGEGPLYQPPNAVRSPPIHGSTFVSGRDRNMDEVDPLTGIALIAQEHAPVLLHCSAGVGRTGGFIAVDAVLDGIRREMRKRKEGKVQETEDAQAASEFQGRSGTASSESRSGSRSRSMSTVSQTPDPMDVDTSPSPPEQKSDMSSLTVPVSVGDREVHVPVVGFAKSEGEAMDVDERQPAGLPTSASLSSPAAKHVGLPPPLLQASPELVTEVRRATMNNWPSMASTTFSLVKGDPAQPRATRVLSTTDPSDSSSESYAARASSRSRSVVGSGSRTRSRSSVSPPTSHAESVMVGKTAKLSMNSPSPPNGIVPLPPSTDPRLRTVSLPSSASSHLASRPEPEPHSEKEGLSCPSSALQSQRLNSWRSEVQSSHDGFARTAEPGAVPSSKADPRPASKEDKSSASADTPRSEMPSPTLREPRKLHDDTSPPPLSTYTDPIRRVIEDMREQRMSLCQSLRQYVFVHRAIIEGALMIVDEEKKRESRSAKSASSSASSSVKPKSSSVPPLSLGGVPSLSARRLSASSSDEDTKLGIGHKRSVPDFVAGNTIIEGVVSPSPGRPKRGASPTELTMEGLDGGVLLRKRPSVKRSQRENEVQFDAMVISSPPGAQ
ncbi:hypothetical protein L227DRAFT_508776 [Lentinus tigrinus ALCF2SS1-6]|uniref:protein-tyrosine-phosphatase n=1 Tax=Lentinus tigrinus ALCF2SS1-6 TaxID=1328759 RepID=A0A5C2RYV7_9APHY|nr:hypothetical protein L227DRAFT_508776 [Lentinus tigrinus ALCF2SS1-6]